MTELEQSHIKHSKTDEGIDLKELFYVLWNGKKIIIIITTLFGLCSVVYSLSLKNYYTSAALFNVAESSERSRGLSGYSDIAALAGISLSNSSADQKGAITIETIKSRGFLEHLLTFDYILPSLMAAKSFDMDTKSLIFDSSKYNSQSNTWVRKVSLPMQPKPSVIETHKEYISKILTIDQDNKTGFIYISIEHLSPIFSKEFLDLIFHEINVLLRQKDLEESTNALEFLNSEASKTSLTEMRNSINQLIQSQLETQMMTKIREDYMLQIIDPPYIPEKKSKPSRAVICILGSILGGFLASFFVLFVHYYRVKE